MKNRITHAIDTSLAGLSVTERDVQSIMLQVREGKRVKKKLSAGLVLAVLIILLAVTALAVSMIGGLRFWQWDEIGSPLDMVTLGDQVFFHTEDALYCWDPSAQETTELVSWDRVVQAGVEPVWSSLFVQDGKVKLFGAPGKVWRYEEKNWVLERDYRQTPMEAFAGRHRRLFQQDGFLFLTRYEESEMANVLYRLQLADGSVERMKLGEVTEICGFRDECILAVVMDHEQEKLILADVQSGEEVQTLAVLHTLSLNGLTYDKNSDRIYAMADGALSVWKEDGWQGIRKSAIPGLTHSFGIAGGKYLAVNHEGIQSIPLEPDENFEPKVIRIRGYRDKNYSLDHTYQLMHPEYLISRQMEAHLCAQEVYKAILEGDQTDLFHLHVNADWVALLESGLLEPLKSSGIQEYTGQADDFFKRLVMADGEAYALLSDVTVTGWSPMTCETVTTYGDLLRSGQEIAWGEQAWTKEDYIRQILKQQIAETGGCFSSEAFAQTLSALKEWVLQEERVSAVDASAVFSLGNLFPERRYCAPLRIDEEKAERYPVRVHLYVLNPNSQNKEAALAFLDYAAAQKDDEQRALLSPYAAQPTLLPFARQWIEDVKAEHVERIVDGADLPQEELERRLEEIRSIPGHWLVEEKRLMLYREQIFPNLDLQLHPLLADHGEILKNMEEEVKHYIADETTLEETIKSLNALAWQK